MKKLSFIAANLLALAVFGQNVTKITFDADADLTSNFYVPEGSTGTFVDDHTLKITPGQSRTLIYDTSPDAVPTNVFSGDFTLSFKFKSNTASLIPPTGNDGTKNISVWASFFPQSSPRLNSPRVKLNLSEMYQDETYFQTGTSMNNSVAAPSNPLLEAINFFRELSPAYNGDTWYTFKLIVLQQGGGNVKCNFTVSDDNYELINNTYTFTGLTTTTGEIAIGGNSNNGNATLSIDDFQVTTTIPAYTEHIYLNSTVAGNAYMYLPPNINSVTGILVMAPGSGANFFYVLQTDYHRKFAQAHNLALLSFDNSIIAPNSILAAVSDFATVTGHSELNTAPYMFYGFSLGSITTNYFVNAYPERVIAYASDGYLTPSSYNAYTRSVPGIFFNGVTDITFTAPFISDVTTAQSANALVGGLVKENYGHIEMGMFNVYLPFFEQAINERNLCNTGVLSPLDQSKGWLMNSSLDSIGYYASGNIGVPIAPTHPYTSYPGDKTKAFWFMNKDVAYVASSFVTFFKQIALTQPYHGTEGESRTIPVRISSKLSRWTRVELYDHSRLVQTIHPGDPLQFTYNNIGKGAHALIAIAIQDNKRYASFPVSLIMSSSTNVGISMPSLFDNGIVTPCTGPQNYSVRKSCGQTYTWSVSGDGNTISSTENTATVTWKSSGTVSVTAYSGSTGSQPRILAVNNDIKSETFKVQTPHTQQNICYITVDSATQKNEIHFVKPSTQLAFDSKKFGIWRETNTPNVFDSVTTIYDISIPFMDQTSNAADKADKYYIKLTDRCGYTHIGDTVQSIHLSASDILAGYTLNFNWSTSYYNYDLSRILYRSTHSAPKHMVYNDVDYQFAYKDTLPNLTENIIYFIEVDGMMGCDSTDLTLTSKIRSNRISFNDATSIKQFNNSNNLTLSPNPTFGMIKATSISEKLNSIIILDALGKVVWSQNFEPEKEITLDLSGLSKGMYIMKLHSESGTVVIKKIIKQ